MSRTEGALHLCLSTSKDTMASAETLEVSNMMSLPEDLLVDIASRLDLKEGCRMECASREFYDVLSRPSHPWPVERGLSLYHIRRPLSPKTFRWIQKRIKRYRHIFCRFCDANLEGTDYSEKEDTSCLVPPRLASLLAACVPSAELSLHVRDDRGEKFLSLGASSIAMTSTREVCSFWADLKLHLTELSLALESKEKVESSEAPDLGLLGMLTALRKLKLNCAAYNTWDKMDLKDQKLKLILPNLVSFKFRALQNGELDLSCPRLAELTVEETYSLRITVEDATLAELVLDECTETHFAVPSPKDQLQNLKTLMVLKGYDECTEQDRQFIEDLAHMGQLERLEYENLSTACIPRSLPQSLEYLRLAVVDQCAGPIYWRPDLRIESVWRGHGDRPWDSTSAKPLAELLLMHDVSPLQMSVLHRVVTCMTGRGLEEAIGSFCCGDLFDTVLVHDPPAGNQKGRFLEARLQDQEKRRRELRVGRKPIPRQRWSPELDLSTCGMMDEST